MAYKHELAARFNMAYKHGLAARFKHFRQCGRCSIPLEKEDL